MQCWGWGVVVIHLKRPKPLGPPLSSPPPAGIWQADWQLHTCVMRTPTAGHGQLDITWRTDGPTTRS